MQRYGMFLADGGQITLTAQSDRFTTNKWPGLLDTRDLAFAAARGLRDGRGGGPNRPHARLRPEPLTAKKGEPGACPARSSKEREEVCQSAYLQAPLVSPWA